MRHISDDILKEVIVHYLHHDVGSGIDKRLERAVQACMAADKMLAEHSTIRGSLVDSVHRTDTGRVSLAVHVPGLPDVGGAYTVHNHNPVDPGHSHSTKFSREVMARSGVLDPACGQGAMLTQGDVLKGFGLDPVRNSLSISSDGNIIVTGDVKVNRDMEQGGNIDSSAFPCLK
jgi:hypothetical protein